MEGNNKKIDLTRRDVLNVLGVGSFAVAATVLVHNEVNSRRSRSTRGIEGKAKLDVDDFLDKPEFWEGKAGDKAIERIESEVTDLFRDVYPFTQADNRQDVKKVGPDFDENAVRVSVMGLIRTVAERGRKSVMAKDMGLDFVKDPLEVQYYEAASYLNMILEIKRRAQAIGLAKLGGEIKDSNVSENLGSFRDSRLEEALVRKKIFAVWNYDFKHLANDWSVSNPVSTQLCNSGTNVTLPFDFKGETRTSGNMAPILILEHETVDGVKRPLQARIVNFDPEVAADIKKNMDIVGIERSVTQVILEYDTSFKGLFSGDSGGAEVHYDQKTPLTFKEYQSIRRQVLHVDFHEDGHSLSLRRFNLPPDDFLKYGNMELAILSMADPLMSLKSIFGTKGWPHGFLEDNDFSMIRYYLENVCNTYDNMDSSAKNYLNEFLTVTTALTGEQFPDNFLQIGHLPINDFFRNLEHDVENYNGAAKFIATTMLRYKSDIVSSPFAQYFIKAEKLDHTFKNSTPDDFVAPLLFAHILLYRNKDLVDACYPETKGDNSGIMANYLETLRKRFNGFVRGEPTEEYLQELFSEALLTKIYGPHPVGYVNEALPIFENMLTLMRKNGLANLDQTSKTV